MEEAVRDAARANSRYPAPGKMTRPCTTWSATSVERSRVEEVEIDEERPDEPSGESENG